MQAILALKIKVDVLHTNDWHTALCNVYIKSDLYKKQTNFNQTKSIITIHNIGYQGIFNKANLYWTGLDCNYFNFLCLEFFDQLNFLKAGVLLADMVTTVSPTYAEEILSAEYGFDLVPMYHFMVLYQDLLHKKGLMCLLSRLKRCSNMMMFNL